MGAQQAAQQHDPALAHHHLQLQQQQAAALHAQQQQQAQQQQITSVSQTLSPIGQIANGGGVQDLSASHVQPLGLIDQSQIKQEQLMTSAVQQAVQPTLTPIDQVQNPQSLASQYSYANYQQEIAQQQ